MLSMSSNALRANQRTAVRRQFSSTAAAAQAKAGLNRYSKIITQPKAQGASQVGQLRSSAKPRLCSSLLTVSTLSRISPSPWSVSLQSGECERAETPVVTSVTDPRYEGNP